jgi:FkbM family methyltransferase
MSVLSRKVHGLTHLLQFDNRWPLIVARLFSGSNKLLVYRLKGMSFLVDHAADDENGTRVALISDMYRTFLERIKLPKEPVVLDLGANGGGFGLLLQALGYQVKRIVAVEMNPHTTQRLRFNLERNLPGEVTVLNCAVCGQPRTLELQLGSGGSGDSIYGPSVSEGTSRVEVQGRTFDDIANEMLPSQRIDVCKIDVEGAEHEIFSRPGHERVRSCRYLIMEIHPAEGGVDATDTIIQKLSELGFKKRPERASSGEDVYFFENQNPLT